MNLRAFIIISLLAVPIEVGAFENEPTGFRGIVFGEDFSVHAGEMTLVAQNKSGSSTAYARKGDKMRIGDAMLKYIRYNYSDNKFFAVEIASSGAANKKALIDAFRLQFGAPDHYNHKRKDDTYEWGDVSKVSVILVCNSQEAAPAWIDACAAIIASHKTLNEVVQEEIKRQREKLEKDF
jgi:hypothetical protein